MTPEDKVYLALLGFYLWRRRQRSASRRPAPATEPPPASSYPEAPPAPAPYPAPPEETAPAPAPAEPGERTPMDYAGWPSASQLMAASPAFPGETIRSYLTRHQVPHFAADLTAQTAGPPELWPSLVPTLRVAEMIRSRVGKPLLIVSAYRSPDVNKQAGGAKDSQHMYGRAIDLSLRPKDSQTEANRGDFYQAALLLWKKYGPSMKMGLGIYAPRDVLQPEGSTFIHLDTGWMHRSWTGPRYQGQRDLIAEETARMRF